MSVDIKIKDAQRKFLMENEMLFRDEDCNVIIPYMPSGYVDYSNNGYVSGQYQIDNFLTYKRVYTGNDCFNVTWKGSTYIKKDLDANGQIQIGWELGEYIFGYNEGLNSSVEIEQDESFADYKKQISINTITFRIRADKYELGENYKYLFYKVPEINKDILYRVVSLETEYLGRVPVCYVLTLQSLQQELENTGRAKQQNVMPNSPGQGYYDPEILPHNKDFVESKDLKRIDETRWIRFSYDKWVNNPVRKVVVKQYGFGIPMNFTMVGRKILNNSPMSHYGTPRLVFPINFRQATTPTLYRTQMSEDNYYFAYTLQPTILFSQGIFDAMKNFMDVDKTWSQQGMLEFNTNPANNQEAAFEVTNPIVDGKYSYSLFGQIKEIGGAPLYTPWTFSLDRELSFDTRGTYGVETTYRIAKRPRAIHDYMWDSYWTQKQISRLPLKRENTITFGSMIGTGIGVAAMGGSKISLIAGSILFGIGLLGSLVTRLPNKNIENGVMGMIPASLFKFMMDEATTTLPNAVAQKNWVKLSYVMNTEKNDFITFFNTQTMNTSFEAYLTDLFLKDNRLFETTYIGQTKREDGSSIYDDGRTLLVDGSEELQPLQSDGEGFIIDSFNLQSIFSGDFSVEFLDVNDEVIWSGVYQSEAKWTGSIREINTWRNTSIYGRENTFLTDPKPWPEDLHLAEWEEPRQDLNVSINSTPSPVNVISQGENLKNVIERYYQNVNFGDMNKLTYTWYPIPSPTTDPENLYIPTHMNKATFTRNKEINFKNKLINTNTLITPSDLFNIYNDFTIYINNTPYKLFENGATITNINLEIVENSNVLNQTNLKNASEVFSKDTNFDKIAKCLGEYRQPNGVNELVWLYRGYPQIGYELKQTNHLKFELLFENDGVYLQVTSLSPTDYELSFQYNLEGYLNNRWKEFVNYAKLDQPNISTLWIMPAYNWNRPINNPTINLNNLFFGEGVKWAKQYRENVFGGGFRNEKLETAYHDKLAAWNDSFTINNIQIKLKK